LALHARFGFKARLPPFCKGGGEHIRRRISRTRASGLIGYVCKPRAGERVAFVGRGCDETMPDQCSELTGACLRRWRDSAMSGG
jgi:hypothetical protein